MKSVLFATLRITDKDVAMTDLALYDLYLRYFECARVFDRTPMAKDEFYSVWNTLSETKRQFWTERFRKGFDVVVDLEAAKYGESLLRTVSSSKAA